MDLASLLMPMISGGMGAQGGMAGMQPIQQPGTQTQQGSMAPYMNSDQMAQLQTDTLDYQRRNQLANALMSQGYVPNSGKFGMLAGIASMLGGKLAQSSNDAKLSDIIKRQYQADSEAAQAKRAQDLQDLINKTNIETGGKISEEEAKARFGKQYAPAQFQGGGMFDPSTGKWVASPDYAKQQIDIKTAEERARAAADASVAGAAGNAAAARIQKIMGMPDGPLKQALLTKELGEGGMQALTFNSMFSGGGSGGGQGGALPTGGTAAGGTPSANGADPDALARLNPGIRAQVQAIGEYRQAPLTSMAIRSPMGAALMQAVNQVYPNYDATAFPTRQKARAAFTSGPEGKMLNSLNTAIGHGAQLLDSADALNNYSGFPFATQANEVANSALSSAGDPRQKAFETARDAFAGEVIKAFRGSSGSEKDIEEMRKNFSSANSPAQFRDAIGAAMKLMGSKAQELGGQYQEAFGYAAPNFSDKNVKTALQHLSAKGVDLGELGTAYGIGGGNGSPSSAAGQNAPTMTATGPNGQKIGLVNGQWVPL